MIEPDKLFQNVKTRSRQLLKSQRTPTINPRYAHNILGIGAMHPQAASASTFVEYAQ